METRLEVLLAPAEFAALTERDLRQTVCVVFDVLRATSTMLTALANGAEAIIPVAEISEALALRAQQPELLLAGERNGLRIRADLTCGVDFDFGNSPREFTPEVIRGKTIVMTTTNGTRALRACAKAQHVLVAALLNLRATANWIEQKRPTDVLLVCSGTLEQPAYEDILAAGALCDVIWPIYAGGKVSDAAQIAHQIFSTAQSDLFAAMRDARNGRRLLARPELAGDVQFCAQRDTLDFVAELRGGKVTKLKDARA